MAAFPRHVAAKIPAFLVFYLCHRTQTHTHILPHQWPVQIVEERNWCSSCLLKSTGTSKSNCLVEIKQNIELAVLYGFV